MAVWHLVRGQNLALIFVAAWVGGVLGATDFQVPQALLGGFCATCLGAYGNAINDLYDRKLDAVRKRHRPIPSGRLSPRAAAVWAAVFGACALLSSLGLYPLVAIVVCFTLASLWIYSHKLKGWRGTGHVLVAGFSGMVFVFGALVQGETFFSVMPHCWSAAVMGILWHLAREWVKSAEDLEDDQALGVRTAAVEMGVRRVCRLAALALGLLVLLLWVPYAMRWFSLTYLLIAAVGIAPVLASVAYYLWNVPDRDRLGQLAFLLKWTMPLGVVALWLG